jgi:serine/threonine protein kinase
VEQTSSYTEIDVPTISPEICPEDEPTSIRPSLREEDFPPRRESYAGGRIGKYELAGKLGQGTFGLVYLARDVELDRDVALKLLQPSHLHNRQIVARFLQEGRAAARIVHPGIVTVLECGTTGDTPYIAMEMLAGESLTARMERSERADGQLAPEIAVEIGRQVASALEAAHRSGILHRDLKPDNIYLVPDPAMPTGERVKVFDFGLAKMDAGHHTTLSSVFGTPRYMSPEQCRSTSQIDQRSDIYALGCVLYELVTGRTPFDGELRQLMERHQIMIPARASTLAPEVGAGLDLLLAQMLAKRPEDRPPSMAAVQVALQANGAITPRPPTSPLAPYVAPRPFVVAPPPEVPVEQAIVGNSSTAGSVPFRPTQLYVTMLAFAVAIVVMLLVVLVARAS